MAENSNGRASSRQVNPPAEGASTAPSRVDQFPRDRTWSTCAHQTAGAEPSDAIGADNGTRRVVVLTVDDDASEPLHFNVGADAGNAGDTTETARLYPGKSVPLPTDERVSVVRSNAATSDVGYSIEVREAD